MPGADGVVQSGAFATMNPAADDNVTSCSGDSLELARWQLAAMFAGLALQGQADPLAGAARRLMQESGLPAIDRGFTTTGYSR